MKGSRERPATARRQQHKEPEHGERVVADARDRRRVLGTDGRGRGRDTLWGSITSVPDARLAA